jgi:hypothetical protein
VVSGAALWINGRPRPATYARREKARRAYEKVVASRRDPLLVTTHGRDRVRLRAFPVPPDGGTLTFRIDVAAPVELRSKTSGRLFLPVFADGNFRVDPKGDHGFSVRVGGKTIGRPLAAKGLIGQGASIEVERSADAPAARGADPYADDGGIVTQRLVVREGAVADPIILVLDGGMAMKPHAASIAGALALIVYRRRRRAA